MKAKLTVWNIADTAKKLEDNSPRYNIIVNAIDFVDACERINRMYHEIDCIDDSYCIDSVFPANSRIPGACDDYFSRVVERKNFICKS